MGGEIGIDGIKNNESAAAVLQNRLKKTVKRHNWQKRSIRNHANQ